MQLRQNGRYIPARPPMYLTCQLMKYQPIPHLPRSETWFLTGHKKLPCKICQKQSQGDERDCSVFFLPRLIYGYFGVVYRRFTASWSTQSLARGKQFESPKL